MSFGVRFKGSILQVQTCRSIDLSTLRAFFHFKRSFFLSVRSEVMAAAVLYAPLRFPSPPSVAP